MGISEEQGVKDNASAKEQYKQWRRCNRDVRFGLVSLNEQTSGIDENVTRLFAVARKNKTDDYRTNVVGSFTLTQIESESMLFRESLSYIFILSLSLFLYLYLYLCLYLCFYLYLYLFVFLYTNREKNVSTPMNYRKTGKFEGSDLKFSNFPRLVLSMMAPRVYFSLN